MTREAQVKYPQAVAEQYFRFALEDLVEHKEIEQGVNAKCACSSALG